MVYKYINYCDLTAMWHMNAGVSLYLVDHLVVFDRCLIQIIQQLLARSIVQQPRTVQLWIENDKKRAAHEKGKSPKRQFCIQRTGNQKQTGH